MEIFENEKKIDKEVFSKTGSQELFFTFLQRGSGNIPLRIKPWYLKESFVDITANPRTHSYINCL